MPKNMKYDAVATKAAGPKKKMKSNQDGGSVTAKDPAAAGKQLAADQTKAAGPAKTRDDRKKSAVERKIERKTASASKAAGQMAYAPIGSKKETRKLNKMRKKVGQRNALQEEMKDSVDGPGKMGYSQKFGPGRMNGYEVAAKKTMDVMSNGGASKYMAEGPAQGANQKIVETGQQDQSKREFRAKRRGKFDAMNERLRINKDEARTQQAITRQHDITSMQADVKDGTRPGFSNPSQNPVDGMTYSYGARLMKGGDAMINPASSDERSVTRGADGYYTANAFPRNRRSARSREEFTGTYGRDRGDRPTPYVRGSFDYAKRRYEQEAQRKATQRNRIIDDFKTKVGIDVNRERMAAAQNTIAAAFNRGIGSVKNSTFKNPTGLKSYETKEIN